MKDSFIIEGKKYISSRRASEISDYSSDYIGQLCRAEKLDCRMIGRAWFITEESLHLHKASILHDEISRNRIENLRGKKMRAAAIVAEVAPATTTADTTPSIATSTTISVALASAPALNSNVTSASSLISKMTAEKKEVAVTVSDSKKKDVTVSGSENVVSANVSVSKEAVDLKSTIPPIVWNITRVPDGQPLVTYNSFESVPVSTSVSISNLVPTSSISINKPVVKYTIDERPLLPNLKKSPASVVKASTARGEKKLIARITTMIANKFGVRLVGKSAVKSTDMFASKSVDVIDDELTNVANTLLASLKVTTGAKVPESNVDQVSMTAHEAPAQAVARTKFTRPIVSYSELTRSIILKRALASVAVLMFVVGLGVTTFNLVNNGNDSVATNSANQSKTNTASVVDTADSVLSSIRKGYLNVLAFFTSPAKIAIENKTPTKTIGEVTISDVTPNGIVLTSSEGTSVADEAVKQKIQGSFSDEVEVKPDKSGTAGVITPVFKESKGKDFIYVMVPVKDKGVSATP